VSPIPQTLTIGFQGLAWARVLVPALITLLLLRQMGTVTLIFAGNTRLPMVAGWDGMLPKALTRLHPRFKTPIVSIAFVGALTLGFTLAGQIGVGLQEAFQLIENVAGILYGFTYVGLFLIPLVAVERLGERPPWWLRLASLSGLAVSLLYCGLSIFPIIEVASWQLFAAKIVATLLVVEVAGIALYAWGARRRRAV
jgi:glutamate:GABA antiporter